MMAARERSIWSGPAVGCRRPGALWPKMAHCFSTSAPSPRIPGPPWMSPRPFARTSNSRTSSTGSNRSQSRRRWPERGQASTMTSPSAITSPSTASGSSTIATSSCFISAGRADTPIDRRAVGVKYQDKSNVTRWQGAGRDCDAAATRGSCPTTPSRAATRNGRTRRRSPGGCRPIA